MKIEEIKALPRTEEGIFDLSGMGDNLYRAAAEVYPVYAAYETDCNKKEGYPDIMAQMRVWNNNWNSSWNNNCNDGCNINSGKESAFADGAYYTAMLLDTLSAVSPEIYENYRELADMFRAAVKKLLEEYYKGGKIVAGGEDEISLFKQTVKSACEKDILLTEKYCGVYAEA